MRTLLIGTLAATLVGCSCLLPPQLSMDVCTDANGPGCLDRTAASQLSELERGSLKANATATKTKSPIAAKTAKPPSAHVRDRTRLAAKKTKSTTIATKVDPPASGQPAEISDPVIIKAKTAIAAKLEDPATAEFVEMKRAIRKNTFGQPVDTICGRVKGKKASGEGTGDRPFLYLVKENDAYVVVDGPANSAAATAYRNICNSPEAAESRPNLLPATDQKVR
jgi:hypothetical protein